MLSLCKSVRIGRCHGGHVMVLGRVGGRSIRLPEVIQRLQRFHEGIFKVWVSDLETCMPPSKKNVRVFYCKGNLIFCTICVILAKEIQSFYKYKQYKYKSTTNLAKEIWRENSKDSPARGLLLYTVLHEANMYNGPVGTCQTMGTHCRVQAWGEWGSQISPVRCKDIL